MREATRFIATTDITLDQTTRPAAHPHPESAAAGNTDIEGRLAAVEAMLEPVYEQFFRDRIRRSDRPVIKWIASPPSIYDVLQWGVLLGVLGYEATAVALLVSLTINLIAYLSRRE